MVRRNLGFWALCGFAAACVAGLSTSTANAGWHWHGSWGGYGSFGSYSSFGSTGAYSSYGSHGGWRLGHLFHHHHHGHHRGWGSHGGWGSNGSSGGGGSYGSYAGWGSSGGGYGSSGGHQVYYGGSSGGGSSGGGYYGPGKGMYPPASPAAPEAPADAAPLPGIQPPPPPANGEAAPSGQATLKVSVPEDALVYVNGLLTKSTGAQRSYMSRGLNKGFKYNYEVRAEAMRDGKRVEETRVVQLTAGETLHLAFNNLEPKTPAETTLTLNVPADAQVTLGGNPTEGEGPVRVFSTTKLGPNDEWSSYSVQVTVERDGKTLTQEKVVSLKAGDSKSLSFDFDSTQFASAR